MQQLVITIIIIVYLYTEAAHHTKKTQNIDIKSTAENTQLKAQNTDTY